MADATTTTGTSEPDDRDAVESTPTTETPASEDRDAESVTITKKQWEDALKWKGAAEALNALKSQPEPGEDEPQPPDAARPGPVDKRKRVEEWKAKDDPVADFTLELAAKLEAMERKRFLDEQLQTMPADERDAVKEHWRKNYHRLGDMNAARAELNAPKYESEVQRLREEVERLKRGPDPDVVNAPPTGGREVTARERKSKMTEAQFDQQAAHIRQTQGELKYMKWVQENAGNIGG